MSSNTFWTSNNANTSLGFLTQIPTSSTGTSNLGFGLTALNSVTTGFANFAFGSAALTANTTGDSHIAIGINSLLTTDGGTVNIGLGNSALLSNVTGSYNIAIGFECGHDALGSRNIFLGYQAGYSETGSDRLYIDNSNSASPLVYGEFDNDLLRVNGVLDTNGGVSRKITTSAAGSYTVLVTDHEILKTAITAAGDTVTLPSGASNGQEFFIKDSGGGATTDDITIATAGAETIDGAATIAISINYGYALVGFDGTNYYVKDSKLT